MTIKTKAWYNHSRFGKVKIIGQVSNGVAAVHQVYKDGISMLFFEQGDRTRPCGFSRLDILEFEGLLKTKAEQKTA